MLRRQPMQRTKGSSATSSRLGYRKHILFSLFLVSGFCGLLYQVVWLRLAFAAFGVITPVVSIVVSVFMLGLAVGSWAGGWAITPLSRRTRISAIWYYAATQLALGLGALAVPRLFALAENRLLAAGGMDSLNYLVFSGAALASAILPWCILMGFTFPLGMAFVREIGENDPASFSFLYLANVIGAMGGAFLTGIVLIELLGFPGTLKLGALCNAALALAAAGLGAATPFQEISSAPERVSSAPAGPTRRDGPAFLAPAILFATGFVSMAMEVVWTRAFTPALRTTVYAFSALLTTYLLATWIGSWIYRRHVRQARALPARVLVGLLSPLACLPVLLNDPRINFSFLRPLALSPHVPTLLRALVVVASIMPFCGLLGYLTPGLVDRHSAGDPRAAGVAYAINTLGCILGPLVAAYGLLPNLGVRHSLVLLAAPFVVFYAAMARAGRARAVEVTALSGLAALAAGASLGIARSYEDGRAHGPGAIRRDATATSFATGSGLKKELFVNGISMTYMTPITKVMAHLPLAFLERTPESALNLCLGMGTSFRSLLSWDIEVVAVELVPGVRDLLGFFFEDADRLLANPKAQIVIDDARRYLRRTPRNFDVITIDPPPPVEAASSSLLYSEEFYRIVAARLNDDGILQQWFPGGEKLTGQAMARALVRVFPYVKVFHSIEDWGYHFLASKKPLRTPSAEEFAARLPPSAAQDLVEWGPALDPLSFAREILRREIHLDRVLPPDFHISITDGRPYNEYFLLRRSWNKLTGRHESLR